jgi:hypothetical protein
MFRKLDLFLSSGEGREKPPLLHPSKESISTTGPKEVATKETNYLYDTNIKTQFSHIIHTGWSCSFLTAAIVRVQMGEVPKLGSQI